MAFWIELHCDYNLDGVDQYGENRCAGKRQRHPAVATLNNRGRLGLVQVINEARERGYRRTREGWACPYCYRKLKRKRRLRKA